MNFDLFIDFHKLALTPSRQGYFASSIMKSIKTITPESLSQSQLHGYLLTAVAPRPICFASTIDKAGKVNLSPFSFFNVFSSNPPIMIFSPARSGRDNSTKDTYENIKEVGEVVINIVNYPIVEQMSLASTAYAKGVNEFEKAGLTQVPSQKIGPPRVGEAPVAFECTVDKIIELGNGPGAGNLVIARVVLIHLQEQYLNKAGKLDTHKLDLVARMGESWYCRAIEKALFEIPKPIRNRGMGIDQLPKSIRESPVLTGNNLGRLGNIANLPTSAEIDTVKTLPEVQALMNQYPSKTNNRLIAFHRFAQELLEMGDTNNALLVLLLHDK